MSNCLDSGGPARVASTLGWQKLIGDLEEILPARKDDRFAEHSGVLEPPANTARLCPLAEARVERLAADDVDQAEDGARAEMLPRGERHAENPAPMIEVLSGVTVPRQGCMN